MRTERDVEGSGFFAPRRPGGVVANEAKGPAASGAGRGDVQRGGRGLPEWRGVAAGALADGGMFVTKHCFWTGVPSIGVAGAW